MPDPFQPMTEWGNIIVGIATAAIGFAVYVTFALVMLKAVCSAF